jgi:hypothetical protein
VSDGNLPAHRASAGSCQCNEPQGKGQQPALLDPQTNLLKNRIDAGDYQLSTIPTLLKLPWKKKATDRRL